MQAWTIKQLYMALQKDLKQCHTETERSCCSAIGGREIREFAENSPRKLTPGEVAIAEQFGFKPR